MFIPKKYLTEKILIESKPIMADNIFKLLLQDENAKVDMDATSDPNFSYYKKLAVDAASGRVQGKHGAKSKLDLNSIKLSRRTEARNLGLKSSYSSLSNVLNELQELMKSKGQYDPNNEISNIIQITTLEILAEVLHMPPPPKPPEPDPEEPEDAQEDPEDLDDKDTPKGKRDWTAEKAKRLANANGTPTSEVLTKFYDDYYSQEFAGVESTEKDSKGIVDRLKSISKILMQECNKLGYNSETNPFVQFLKILIKLKLKKENKSNIFDKLTTNTYGAIHNSYADKNITGNELGNYNKKHLLFCEDLYNRKGLEIVEYLRLYHKTLNKAKDKEEDKFTLAAKIFVQQKLTNEEADEDPGFAEKIAKLLQLSEQELILPTANAAKLRTIPEIEELFTYIFKASPKAEKNKENKVLKSVIDLAASKKAILDMIKYILSIEAFRKAYPEDVNKAETQLKELNYTINKGLLAYSKQILDPHLNELTGEELRLLVKKAFTAYGNSLKKAGN